MPHQRGTRRVASPPLLHSDAPSVAAPWDTHTNRDLAGCPSLPSLPNGGAVASKLLKHLPAAAAGSGREQRSLKTWMPPRRTTLPSPPHAVDRTARIHAIRTHCPHTLRCVGHGACSMLPHMLRSTTGGGEVGEGSLRDGALSAGALARRASKAVGSSRSRAPHQLVQR